MRRGYSGSSEASEPPRFDVEEIVVSGDWAWCRTHLTVTMTPPDGPKTESSGYALTIFRKQDGAWLLARDANLIATPPGEPQR